MSEFKVGDQVIAYGSRKAEIVEVKNGGVNAAYLKYKDTGEKGWCPLISIKLDKLDLPVKLARPEKKALDKYEGVIQEGMEAFVKVGKALQKIRDNKLYRAEYATFEEYLDKRWEFSRRRGYQVISAAQVAGYLSTSGTQTPPENERQVRPLVNLPPDEQVKAWSEAVSTAPDGKVTAAHVERVANQHRAFRTGEEVIFEDRRFVVTGVRANFRLNMRDTETQGARFDIDPAKVKHTDDLKSYDITDPAQNPLAETHPIYGTNPDDPAFCPSCGDYHAHWKAVPGAFWRCKVCGEEIRDDAMEVETAEDRAAAASLNGHRNGRHKPKTSYKPASDSETHPKDNCQTPPYALVPLLQYLKLEWTIWESACGEGLLASILGGGGLRKVIATDLLTGTNFFHQQPVDVWDCLVTNPPFSLKYDWLERCYALGKPFALLMPIDTLGSKQAQDLFRTRGIEVILMNERVDYKMVNMGWEGSGAQFNSAWFTWRLGIGHELTFADITEAKQSFKLSLEAVNVLS